MDTLGYSTVRESSRETEIARLVHFIQVQDFYNAETMLLRFRQRGERVSREIMNAYWKQIHASC